MGGFGPLGDKTNPPAIFLSSNELIPASICLIWFFLCLRPPSFRPWARHWEGIGRRHRFCPPIPPLSSQATSDRAPGPHPLPTKWAPTRPSALTLTSPAVIPVARFTPLTPITGFYSVRNPSPFPGNLIHDGKNCFCKNDLDHVIPLLETNNDRPPTVLRMNSVILTIMAKACMCWPFCSRPASPPIPKLSFPPASFVSSFYMLACFCLRVFAHAHLAA